LVSDDEIDNGFEISSEGKEGSLVDAITIGNSPRKNVSLLCVLISIYRGN
jgi:hypothetical protein